MRSTILINARRIKIKTHNRQTLDDYFLTLSDFKNQQFTFSRCPYKAMS